MQSSFPSWVVIMLVLVTAPLLSGNGPADDLGVLPQAYQPPAGNVDPPGVVVVAAVAEPIPAANPGLSLWVAGSETVTGWTIPGCMYDLDGDGVCDPMDCDDLNPDVSPLTPEIHCDGVDQNCDGWDYCDADGDGTISRYDCDDSDPGTRPGAHDVPCDGVDQDCMGGDCCGQDTDADGYPCETDCNDQDPSVHPGATDDCDGIDRDCDGMDGNGGCTSS